MSEKISPCMTGDQITSETILRAHFSAGGIVQIAGVEKWYRMPTTQLLALNSTSSDWTDSFRELCELVRTEKVIACDEPELSREIRGDAERERQREEDNEQVRRDVGAPHVMKKINPCRCDGCERTKNGVSVFHTQFTPHGMVAVIAAHGDILLQLVPVDKVIELRDEINRWLDGAA